MLNTGWQVAIRFVKFPVTMRIYQPHHSSRCLHGSSIKFNRSLFIVLGIGLVVAILGTAFVVTSKERKRPTIQKAPRSTNTFLKPDDLQFGRQQVDQMMRDREEMGTCVEKGDVIYEWAARQFAGEAVGQRIYWSSNPPDCPPDCLSSIQSPYKSFNGYIAIREHYAAGSKIRQKILCEELWACAVYELYNISYAPESNALHEAALAGRFSKQEFVMNLAKIEYHAEQQTAQFYWAMWRPWAENKGLVTSESHWFTSNPDTYDEWIRQFTDPAGYPYSYYSRDYDERIAPHVKQ